MIEERVDLVALLERITYEKKSYEAFKLTMRRKERRSEERRLNQLISKYNKIVKFASIELL